MLKVVVESPFRANSYEEQQANVRYARKCLKDSCDRGEAPLASHLLYTQILDDSDKSERETGISAGLEWLKVADMVAVYTDRGISEGMGAAIERAERIGLVVVYRNLGD